MNSPTPGDTAKGPLPNETTKKRLCKATCRALTQGLGKGQDGTPAVLAQGPENHPKPGKQGKELMPQPKLLLRQHSGSALGHHQPQHISLCEVMLSKGVCWLAASEGDAGGKIWDSRGAPSCHTLLLIEAARGLPLTGCFLCQVIIWVSMS